MIDKFNTRLVRISSVAELPRIRKRMEGIDELADDIRKNGLINPITVMDCGDGSYQLIAGQRRLHAVRRCDELTIRATVLGPIDAQKALELEYAENEQRQQFTVAERLSFAEKLKVIEQAKARERMSIFAREGHYDDEGRDARPYPDKGRARDAIAKKVGFNSGRQLDRAMAVADQRPDLLEKIDSGETTIYGAYQELTKNIERLKTPVPEEAEEAADEQPATPSFPTCIPKPVTGRGALVDELQLRLDRATQVCHYLQRVIDTLTSENRELRRRLGLTANEPIITKDNEEDTHYD